MNACEVALQLAEEWGLPVFPCRPDKSPAVAHGFKDASRNIEQIARWWGVMPDALVGVPTGAVSRLIVLDIDPDGASWYQQHQLKLACSRIHKTPRGHHLLYAMPSGDTIACSAGKLRPGVDVRGDGGYIVWWPGSGYEAVGDLQLISEPPPALMEKLRALNGAGDAAQAARAASLDDAERIPDGQRNAALTRFAGKLRRIAASEAEIVAALTARNAQCEPPLGAGELRTIAHSVARYAPHEDPQPPEEHSCWLAQVRLELNQTFLIRRLLPEAALAVVYGSPGCGKSTLALSAAFAIAHGLPWRDLPVRAGMVAYLAGEGRVGVERRLLVLLRQYPQLEPGPLWLDYSLPNLRSVASVDRLIERIRAAEQESGQPCVVLFVDTLSRHLYGSDNDPEHMSAMIACVDRLRATLGCAVVLIHHCGKDAERGARGWSGLLGATDVEIEVSTDGMHWATNTKQRDAERAAPMGFELTGVLLGKDHDGEDVSAAMVEHRLKATPPKCRPKGAQQARVLLELERRRAAGEVAWTGAEIAKIAQDLKVPRSTSYRVAADLEKDRFLQASAGGYCLSSGVSFVSPRLKTE